MYLVAKLMSIETKERNVPRNISKQVAIAVVAVGYGGHLGEELCNELDYHYNKVKCRKIEQMMSQLMKMMESEMENYGGTELRNRVVI